MAINVGIGELFTFHSGSAVQEGISPQYLDAQSSPLLRRKATRSPAQQTLVLSENKDEQKKYFESCILRALTSRAEMAFNAYGSAWYAKTTEQSPFKGLTF